MLKSSNKTTDLGWTLLFISVFIAVWANSIIGTTDVANWLIENTLTVISLLLLITTYKKYRFSNVSYLLLCLFYVCICMVQNTPMPRIR